MPSNSPLMPLCKELALRFPGHLSGSFEGLFVVVSERSLTTRTYQALSASAIASGFGCFSFDPFPAPRMNDGSEPLKEGKSPLTLITIKGEDVSRETLLSPADLILTIETFDPLAVVSVDMISAKALADAYQTQVKLNTPQTLLGRPLRCFENFDSMISTNEGKQNAWKLLKNISVNRP